MEILTEIVEISNKMIVLLIDNNFFDENIFVEPKTLKLELQKRMQRKWEEQNDMLLTDKEFLDTVNSLIQQSVSESLSELVAKGAVNMSVDETGEIVYSANKDFDQNNL
jgi:hypothetical protein